MSPRNEISLPLISDPVQLAAAALAITALLAVAMLLFR